MKILSSLLISFIIVCNTVSGQVSSGTVEGTVGEALSGKHVAFATVALLKSSDSTMVKGALTDTSGVYVIENVAEGNYVLATAYVGFTKKYSEPFHVSKGEKIKAKPLLLKARAGKLKEVEITAMKPLFEQKPGMMIVNVEGTITDVGNSAMDILEKSPGVNVDDQDNISVKGKTGVVVMIDDKPTYLSSTDLANYLKSIPASSISSIEIMTNPPAKYDAAGTAGIINIRLKKNTNLGFTGSVIAAYRQGRYPFYNPGINLSYKSRKVNLFGAYNLYDYNEFSNVGITRRYYNADTLNSVFVQNRYTKVEGLSGVFKTGMDYYINNHNTIGFIVTGIFNNNTNDVTNLTDINNNNNELQSTELSKIYYKNNNYNISYNLNYKAVLDTSGTSLTINADYANYNNTGTMNFNTGYFSPDGATISAPTIWAGNQAALINIESFKVDFDHPMRNGFKLQAGIKSSLVSSDNNLFFQDYINNVWVVDTGITNHFKYTENINAGYVDISKTYKGFSVEAGLRGEQTIATGEQLLTDSSYHKNYFQLFPTLFMDKTINKENEITLSYSRRIDRPNYGDLNPFRYYIDPLTYKVGNTNLGPQTANNIELSHIYKSKFVTTLALSQINNVITDVITQDNITKATVQTKDNLNIQNTAALSCSLPVQVTKWWQTSNYVMVLTSQYKGQYLGLPMNVSAVNYEINTQNSFVLPFGLIGQLSGYYKSGAIDAALNEGSSWTASAGLKKSFWNKRANIKVSVNDIFYTQRFIGVIDYQGIDINILSKWDSRTGSVAFTYVFGNTNVNSGNHRSGIEDEQQRVK